MGYETTLDAEMVLAQYLHLLSSIPNQFLSRKQLQDLEINKKPISPVTGRRTLG
jgi:hypothetical protein